MPKTKSNKLSVGDVRFIEPMYARLVRKLPEGTEWQYEVKCDGYRCLAGRDSSKVTLWSRRGNVFTTQFPIIAHACERLPSSTLLDGEIVAVMNNDGFPLICCNTTVQRQRRCYFTLLIFWSIAEVVC